MSHHPPADLTTDQIRTVLMLRGIAVADDDLAALLALARALRQQADGLLDAVRDDRAGHGDIGALRRTGDPA
jgi:hypothetical protein